MNDSNIWSLETRLWIEPSFPSDLLDMACLLALPDLGVMRAIDISRTWKRRPRWTTVDMTYQILERADEDIVVLGYTAEGKQQQKTKPYRCFCTSTYRRSQNLWKLIQHQRTTIEAIDD